MNLVKSIAWLAVVIVVALGGREALGQAAKGEPYKLGIVLPLTGTSADYGADFKAGAVLAEEEINAAGGIKGRPLQLVYGDSKALPKDGVAEFKRLVSIEKVPAVISPVTGVILPQFPLVKETSTVLMCVLSSPTPKAAAKSCAMGPM